MWNKEHKTWEFTHSNHKRKTYTKRTNTSSNSVKFCLNSCISKHASSPSISVQGATLNNINQFTYLGSILIQMTYIRHLKYRIWSYLRQQRLNFALPLSTAWFPSITTLVNVYPVNNCSPIGLTDHRSIIERLTQTIFGAPNTCVGHHSRNWQKYCSL